MLAEARAEIDATRDGDPPPILDPFGGGGTIPLEAQRLGLRRYASDLNPVAVLIKQGADRDPAEVRGPAARASRRRRAVAGAAGTGAQGLAEDVRPTASGCATRPNANRPPLPEADAARTAAKATVIAWIWARTVSARTRRGGHVPLVRSWVLGKKPGQGGLGRADRRPRRADDLAIEIRQGGDAAADGTVGRGAEPVHRYRCADPVELHQGRRRRRDGWAQQLMAVVAEGDARRVYLAPTTTEIEAAARSRLRLAARRSDAEHPQYRPPRVRADDVVRTVHGASCSRSTTFCDLVGEVASASLSDARLLDCRRRRPASRRRQSAPRPTPTPSRRTWRLSSTSAPTTGQRSARWDNAARAIRNTVRTAGDPDDVGLRGGEPVLGVRRGTGSAHGRLGRRRPSSASARRDGASVAQRDARARDRARSATASCRPIRRTTTTSGTRISPTSSTSGCGARSRTSSPTICRHAADPEGRGARRRPSTASDRQAAAEEHFEDGMRRGLRARRRRAADRRSRDGLLCVQGSRESSDGRDRARRAGRRCWRACSTRACGHGDVADADRAGDRTFGIGHQRPRLVDRARVPATRRSPRRWRLGASSSRRCGRSCPSACGSLQQGNIAPVDLAQAAIGPGWRSSRVRQGGRGRRSAMTVRTALGLINQVLDEVLAEQEGDFDADTRLARRPGSSSTGQPGPVRRRRDACSRRRTRRSTGCCAGRDRRVAGGQGPAASSGRAARRWDPATDARLTVWEVTQHLIRALEAVGERGGGSCCAHGRRARRAARELAYRLYAICERKKWAEEAGAYNALVGRGRRSAGSPRAGLPSASSCSMELRGDRGVRRMVMPTTSGSAEALDAARDGLAPVLSSASGRPRTATTGSTRCTARPRRRRRWPIADRPRVPAQGDAEHVAARCCGNGSARRSAATSSELREVRNRWAHQEQFSTDDAYRALDTIERLLAGVQRGRAGRRGRGAEAATCCGSCSTSRRERSGARPRRSRSRASRSAGSKPWREVVTPHPDVASGGSSRPSSPPTSTRSRRGEADERVRGPGRVLPSHVPHRRAARAAAQRGPAAARRGRRPGRRAADQLRRRQDPLVIALYHLAVGHDRRTSCRVSTSCSPTQGSTLPPTVEAGGARRPDGSRPASPHDKADGTEVTRCGASSPGSSAAPRATRSSRPTTDRGTNPGDALVELLARTRPSIC